MNPFKRLIVGLSAVLLCVGMAVGTVAGALLGRAVAQMVSTSPFLSQRAAASIAGMPDIEFGGLLTGGLIGFLIPAVAASLLFLVQAIRKQSQETAEGVAALRRASAAKRVEPPAAQPGPRRVENGAHLPRPLRPSGPQRPAWRSRPQPAELAHDPVPERFAEQPAPVEMQQPQQTSS